MRSDCVTTIAPRGVVVKSNHLGERRKTQTTSGKYPSCRPDVLSKMPRSCNIVFDVLRVLINPEGQAAVSVRNLAQVTRLSPQTVSRALRRLRGANLITVASAAQGRTACTWQVRWRAFRGAFPQFCVTPAPIRYNPENKDLSPNGTPSSDNEQPKPSRRALAWATAQVRDTLSSYSITQQRKKLICNGIGTSLWRVMCRGRVRAGPELGVFVRDLLWYLSDARGVGNSQRCWCSWARWAIDSILEDYHAAEASLETSERLIATIRREKQEAKGGLDRFLAEAGTQTLSGYIRLQLAQSPRVARCGQAWTGLCPYFPSSRLRYSRIAATTR